MNLKQLIGNAIIYSSIQLGFAGLNLTSRFHINHPFTDQQTLQNESDALEDYIKIGCLWTLGVVILFYEDYGWVGFGVGLTLNVLIMTWIYFSYIKVFDKVAEKYGYEYTKPFQ